jgi:hypothetical protein
MKFKHSITGCFLYTYYFFSHNLHLRLRPYASAKQGHACLPCTNSFPVHVAMSSLHESRFSTYWSLNSLNPASNGAPVNFTTSIHSTQLFVNVPHTFFLHHSEFNYSSLFVTFVRHRRHFRRLLQRYYLSDDRVLIHMCAINISVATSQFSHCCLYCRMRKKWGALLSEQHS